MTGTLIPSAPAELRYQLAYGVDAPPSPNTRRLTEFLTQAFGPATVAMIHYGSHAQRSDAKPESAHDFFVIVEGYLEAYQSLASAVGTSFWPTTAAALNHVLPPNVVSVRMRQPPRPLHAKCAVYSLADLQWATSSRARDHFALGRLFQQVQLAWTRDAASREAVLDCLVAARVNTFRWGRPYLPAHFDAESYCRTLLETSYGAEIRPEGSDRVAVLLEAQRDVLTHVYDSLLQHLASRKVLSEERKVYTDLHPPGTLERLATDVYFRVSKVRATARWMKYISLYDDWLDYIVQKIARRSGMSVELTARERRWPLIFLWPKAIQYLRTRPQRRP